MSLCVFIPALSYFYNFFQSASEKSPNRKRRCIFSAEPQSPKKKAVEAPDVPLSDSDHNAMVVDAPVDDEVRPRQWEASEPPQQQTTQDINVEGGVNEAVGLEAEAQGEQAIEQGEVEKATAAEAEDDLAAAQPANEQAAAEAEVEQSPAQEAQAVDRDEAQDLVPAAQAADQFEGAQAEAVAPPQRARRGRRAVQVRAHPYAARGPMDERQMELRRIAAERGWVGFLEPPAVTVLANGRQRVQRQAARVSQAKTRYIANALRPNLAD